MNMLGYRAHQKDHPLTVILSFKLNLKLDNKMGAGFSSGLKENASPGYLFWQTGLCGEPFLLPAGDDRVRPERKRFNPRVGR